MKILFFGDVVGKTGRKAVAKILPELKKKHQVGLTIANAENSAHGIGLTSKTCAELLAAGVDFLTSGNHVFDKPEQAEKALAEFSGRLIRPANFEGAYAGPGWADIAIAGHSVAVASFNSQVFMEKQFSGLIASPFKALDRFLQTREKSGIIIVDFHSEATSEKRAFGFYAAGRVTAVIGTHTHVQTADAQVLSGGTAYISDVGMTGAADSVLGVDKDKVIKRFLEDEQAPMDVDEGNVAEVGYVVIEADEKTGRAISIVSHLDKVIL
jgi:metallophosphoesterase (TIGR00282 family)